MGKMTDSSVEKKRIRGQAGDNAAGGVGSGERVLGDIKGWPLHKHYWPTRPLTFYFIQSVTETMYTIYERSNVTSSREQKPQGNNPKQMSVTCEYPSGPIFDPWAV